MALDGIVLSSVTSELKNLLIGGRIDKIYQIEKEDILISVRGSKGNYKLLLTANNSYPRVHISKLAKSSAQEPPMFCMLLRKHLSGGRILDISQPDLERIVELNIEATNELGDKESKKLIIEIMGRHSNIILTKSDNTIIDSIKHIANDKSSIREVLPNRIYVRPPNSEKLNPLDVSKEKFIEKIISCSLPVFKSLYSSFNGLSPVVATEICLRANLDRDISSSLLSNQDAEKLFSSFQTILAPLKDEMFAPVLYVDEKQLPTDFYCFPLDVYDLYESTTYETISELLEYYYFEKSTRFNVSQKTGDIKKLIHTFIERSVRKKVIQEKALEECTHKDLYKIYGELLTAYSHQIPPKSNNFVTTNYYEEPYDEITIPLDIRKTAIENAQHYFKLYNKAKRTEVAATNQLISIEEDINYLSSVLLSLDLLETKEDIQGLRLELVDMGYLKKRKQSKKDKVQKSKLPYLHFKSSLGHDIYVGKNNYQNDELTMKFAKSNDLWLHIKDGPGSHVIIKTLDGSTIGDETILEGAMLAAYHSSGKMSSHVPIDYTYKKNVKKVPNAKPGMVIYTNFKTILVTPTEAIVRQLTSSK